MSKRLVAKALDRVGVWGAILRARRVGFWPWSGLTVVLYHRVVGAEGLGELDPDLVDATPEEFEQQMKFLRRHFVPVALEDVSAAATDPMGAQLPPNAVLVSFDDGYRDNYEHALPILQRQGLKAAFFVSTSYITERRLFWWEQVSLFIRTARVANAKLTYPIPTELDLSNDAGRGAAMKQINRLIKDQFALDIDRLLRDLAAACGVDWSAEREHALADKALMTWEQVRGLIDAGMAVGSHTCNHRVLQTLPPDALNRELTASRSELETRLGVPIDSIAYPVGRSIASRPAIMQALARAGYRVGFTAVPGTNRFPGSALFDLRRIPIDRGTSIGATRANLAVPWLAR
jgi:peptidoglycan/xylan/chitin deacetylase (PgdA/CDA1 family)